MKDTKKVLSVQVDTEIIELLKELCIIEKRSQAKMLEFLIIKAHKSIVV